VRPLVSWKLRLEEWIKSSGTGLPVTGEVFDTKGIMENDYSKRKCTVDCAL